MARALFFAVLLAFAAVATAQSCPSKTCTTGGMGNVDCCKHNFSADPVCSWPNTPVKFRVQGKCEQGGQTYGVLNESNSQGPPNQNNPCRCPTPMVSGTTKPMPVPVAQPAIIQGADIAGQDIPSNGQPFTRYCIPNGGFNGKYGYDGYIGYCMTVPGCVAITTEKSSSGCAYLKKAGAKGQLSQNANFVVVTTQVAPAPPCKFVNLGESCTMQPYPWVAQPICCGGNKNKCVNGKCASSYPTSG